MYFLQVGEVMDRPAIESEFVFRNVRNSMARAQEVISSSIRKKAPPSYSGLMCWSCKADNMEQCIEKGEVEICDTLEVSRVKRFRWRNSAPS